MKKINWLVITIVGILAILFLFGGGMMSGWGYRGYGMMGGPGGMMGGWGYSPFGWIGMAFMWLIPLGFLTLIVLGIAWVVKATGGGNNPVAPAQTCSSCGRGIQADWKNCPYCGTALTK